jgi:Holliday junction DNA helicase RuvA
MIASRIPDAVDTASDLMSEAYEALLSVGHTPQDARERIETVMQPGKKFRTVEDVLTEIYQRQKK